MHDSVGGQPTLGFDINFTKVAKACGYKNILGPLLSIDDIRLGLQDILNSDGPSFMEIHIIPGARKDLGRPKESPATNKELFKKLLGS